MTTIVSYCTLQLGPTCQCYQPSLTTFMYEQRTRFSMLYRSDSSTITWFGYQL